MATTPRWGLRYPLGSSAPDVPLWMHDLATDLDGVAMDDQGLLDDRPVSTVGSPGKKGRYWYATDTKQLFRDNGTGWDMIAVDVPEAPFSTYKSLGVERLAYFSALVGAMTYVMTVDPLTFDFPTALGVFYLNPADWAAGSRATRLRVAAQLYTGSTAPGMSFTVGLYAVTAVTATSPVATLGSAVSTVAFATPGASSMNQAVTPDFAAPAAGHYALVAATSGAMASGSKAAIRGALQMRQM